MDFSQYRWIDADFGSLCWHDDVLRSIAFRDPPEERKFPENDLILTIDHWMRWNIKDDGSFECGMAPAQMTFLEVHDLTIDIALGGPGPLEIKDVTRIEITSATEKEYGHAQYRWSFDLWNVNTWYENSTRNSTITFVCRSFEQILTGSPIPLNP